MPVLSFPPPVESLRGLARWVLALYLVVVGTGQVVSPTGALAQLPPLVPGRSALLSAAGVVAVALGLGLVVTERWRRLVGWALALFLVALWPGHLYQAVAGIDPVGLDSTAARWGRVVFQPVLIVWALWCTGVTLRAAPPRRSPGPRPDRPGPGRRPPGGREPS